MPSAAIPDRDPVGDAFTGYVLRADNHNLLANEPLAGCEVIVSGDIILRYGARYLGKPHLSVVPGLIALDYGDMLTGDEAWQFLVERSNRYPRADVIGYRNDGVDEMILVKHLDLALTPHVLVYPDAAATTPLVQLSALIMPANVELPPRLGEYLPRYEDLESWRSALSQSVTHDE